ncbi:MAG: hypothetical protein K2X86_15850 [Cytophagaceae bacterium]|nr:hypothetical protein [Cytophagaceae bacterium]
MALIPKLELHAPQIEKILFILIFASVFLILFMPDQGEALSIALIVLQVALITLYILVLDQKLYILLWLCFLLGVLSIFFAAQIHDTVYYFINGIGYLTFGIIVLVRAVKVSLQHKNFEMLTFIMGFLLVIRFPLPYITRIEEIFTFYNFALCAAIGMTIYNDNLWHRYTNDEKNIIKYILIVFLVMVIQSSFSKFSL